MPLATIERTTSSERERATMFGSSPALENRDRKYSRLIGRSSSTMGNCASSSSVTAICCASGCNSLTSTCGGMCASVSKLISSPNCKS
ncbi:hypothetical protein D3C73_1469870 [compost metagenome]